MCINSSREIQIRITLFVLKNSIVLLTAPPGHSPAEVPQQERQGGRQGRRHLLRLRPSSRSWLWYLWPGWNRNHNAIITDHLHHDYHDHNGHVYNRYLRSSLEDVVTWYDAIIIILLITTTTIIMITIISNWIISNSILTSDLHWRMWHRSCGAFGLGRFGISAPWVSTFQFIHMFVCFSFILDSLLS